jgi:hypothetical protein
MARKTRELKGFIAELKDFQNRLLPKQFVAFQKWLSLELYKRIMQKTPVDEGILRGSWTISVGAQDRSAANKDTGAKQGESLTASELSTFTAAINGISDLNIGQIVWINNAMPYVLRIEFDGHSSVKAPAGMVQISINELKTWLKSAQSEFVKISRQIT